MAIGPDSVFCCREFKNSFTSCWSIPLPVPKSSHWGRRSWFLVGSMSLQCERCMQMSGALARPVSGTEGGGPSACAACAAVARTQFRIDPLPTFGKKKPNRTGFLIALLSLVVSRELVSHLSIFSCFRLLFSFRTYMSENTSDVCL